MKKSEVALDQWKGLTARQLEVMETFAGEATHEGAGGGSRSGKTFLIVRAIVLRALKAPGSRHAILRFRFNHVKSSIIRDTFPKVMKLCFPEVQYKLDQVDWFVKIPVQVGDTVEVSEIWFGGLDEKARTEKILGMEYVTIFLNECSQITYGSVEIVRSRLAQKVYVVVKGEKWKLLKPRMFYDFNPPLKSHWTYKYFIKKWDPEDNKPLTRPERVVYCKINPDDNKENQAEGYLEELDELSAAKRLRFRDGEFGEDNPHALFNEVTIETWREDKGDVPPMVRIVVAVDPSGADDNARKGANPDNDEIGIAVVGLGRDGNAYLLEDLTLLDGPAVWGKIAVDAYHRHVANAIVAEENFGGAMVRFVIQTVDKKVTYKKVTAARGKIVRAEPFSALYEKGKVRHVGQFHKLEEEMMHFTTFGYTGPKSPNRADALFWALAELFPALVSEPPKAKTQPNPGRTYSGAGAIFGNGR